MSKVDWDEALLLYSTQHNQCYEKLANRYGVAKSTIVRHAVKHNWQSVKEKYHKKRFDNLIGRTLKGRNDAEERQLKIVQVLMSTAHHEAVRLAYKIQDEGEISSQEFRSMNHAMQIAQRAIKLERLILGLPTKPLRVRDPIMIAKTSYRPNG